MSVSEKIIAALALLGILVAVNAVTIIHILDAGKAEEIVAINKASQAAAIKAREETHALDTQVSDSIAAHDAELRGNLTTVFVDTPRLPVSANQTRMSESTRSPASQPTSPGAGSLCQTVLLTSPDELQFEFDNAKLADTVIADYRELYTAWPQLSAASAQAFPPSK